MCASRTLLIDGRVELKRGLQRQERHLFLFSDLLVVVKIKYNNNFKIKNKIKLTDMWTASCVEEVGEGNTSAVKSFVLGWPTVNFVATFSSPEQKDKWLFLLQRYINLEKEKDYPKSIPLKIFAKDIGNCAYSKTITVTNSDTASEVINMSLRMLGVTGSERDFQLWVNSGKEAAPYPLIGHEFPYGIKMSHLRDTALLTQGSKDSATLSSLQEPFLMEQLPREMQCQFILKPSHLAATQHLSDSGQKTVRRRRSIINWAFWRGSSTHLDNLPMSPTSPVPGQLFGVSLQDICENDNLPKSVLDMLFFLNQKGPLTRGIFRQSANVKSCRELKEKLNSGAEVHLDCESIFVIASVLKVGEVHLLYIPPCTSGTGCFVCLFINSNPVCRECVMDQGNDEEKINAIQRLLDQLPRANVILLRYLFGVLYNIEKNSSTNQMNAFNLAVCVTPSLIWPPTSSSPELEHEFTKKVSLLIQFLIENCCRIFGHEITSLFGEISVRCDTKENSSDTSCVQLNDSSYDSLENELNEDADAPCSDLVRKLGQGSRSMDSVLTLSDYDIDQPEVEGLLALSEFDLDRSKHQDIQVKRPAGSKQVKVLVVGRNAPLVERPGASSSVCTPSYRSTAAAEAPQSLRRHRRCSEPSIDPHDSKGSYLKGFYQKKLRKSSCDAILSQNDEDDPEQNQPLPEEDKTCLEQSLVTNTDPSRKNATNKNIKKSSLSATEGNHVKLSTKSRPVAISVAPYSHASPRDHSRSPHSDANTSGYTPTHIRDTLKSSRTHRRCSEPSIDDQKCKLTYLRGIYSKKQHKSSCQTVLLQGEEDYLRRHKSLQMEGQKLINQSLVMGIEVGRSSATHQSAEKVLPPRLSLCPSSSSSSLSSPGTSPSGSSVSSQDSAFSQISEHSVFTPTETSSPIDCTFQAQKRQENPSFSFISKVPGPSIGQASSHLTYMKKDTIEWHSQMHSVTLHPSAWLKNSVASLKNWSLKKKAKLTRPEEKKLNLLKGPLESPPHASDVSEASSLQQSEKGPPPTATEGPRTSHTARPWSSGSCQDSDRHCSSPFSLQESRLKFCGKSYGGGETEGPCCSGPLPWEKASSSPGTVNDMTSPDEEPTVVPDAGDKHLAKDI
nr:rho GTPase-activating protein 20 [Cavia porcellus]